MSPQDTKTQPQPLLLMPELKRRIWGGTGLDAIKDAQVEPGHDPIGEAWLAYDHSPVHASEGVAGTLAEHVQRDRAAWLGPSPEPGDGPVVPIMLKILDAADDLSVQVHPSDTQVTPEQRAAGHRGKTESWVVLDASQDAHVLWGTKAPMDLAQARVAAGRGDLHRHLRRVPVHAGSIIHNPAGTVHAVGRGLRIFELQQASDITYRLDDYGRQDAGGHLRELHVEEGLRVSNLGGRGSPHPEVPAGAPDWTAAACEYYLLRDVPIRGAHEIAFARPGIRFVTVIEGEIQLDVPGGPARFGPLTYPATVAVPAVIASVTAHGNGRLMVSEAST